MIVQNSTGQTAPMASSLTISLSTRPTPVRTPVAEAPVLPQAEPQAVPKVEPLVTSEQVGAALETANETLRRTGSSLQFTIDKETDAAVVTMVDTESGEVIRQIPSEEALAITRSIDEMLQRSASSRGPGVLYKQIA